MTTNYTPILQLALPVTGELNGTWGDVVNDNITSMIEQAIAGMASITTWTGASHTLTTADGTTDEARCAILDLGGSPGGAATVICPARTKLYIVHNNVGGGYAATLRTASGTGISIPSGKTMVLYCDGTNVVEGSNYVATAANAATADKWTTARNLAGNSVDGSADVAFSNKFIVQGTTDSGLSGAQFLGSLATGLVKNTTTTGVLSIATSGTDYAPATSGTSILKGNGSGGFSNATSGTDYAPATSGTSILYGNGTGGFSNVTIGSGVSFAGGTLSATGTGGTVTSVTGTSPVASSGGTTPAISLASGYGDTQNPYASKTANYFLAAPNGASGVPTFRAMVAADVPTLNQNTTGSSASLSVSGQTGLMTVTGLTSVNRTKTVRDAADTILEQGGSYTPTGTWTWTSATATWPTFNQNTTGSAAKWTTARTLAGNSVDGSANVTFSNKFIVQGTTDAGLSGAQFLGALGTGLVKNTTSTGVLSIATSGTDYAPATSGTSILYGNGSGGFSNVTVGSGLSFSAGTLSASGSGTVTSVSVVSANGLAGTVANATTTPAITLSTSVTGVLKGNGTAISAAVSGTDYAPATSGTSILKGNGTGGFSNATSGTDYAPATSGSSILYGNGAGGFSNVTVGSGLSFSAGTLSASGSGTVTSVSFTGGIVSVATATTTPALTVAGTSGGIPYFSSGTTWASSGVLAANALVIGGGAGVAPSTTTTGTGVLTALGQTTNTASGLVTGSGTVTLTNKWVQPRVLASTANSATPTLNTDSYDMMVITGQSVAITSFTTNLTGTPVNGQKLWIAITGTTAIAITWGASFESSTIQLPTTTTSTDRLDVGFVWNAATSKWRCVASA